MKGKTIPAVLCALCALALAASAQQPASVESYTIDKDTPARARAWDIKPPVVAVRHWFMSACGANGYLVKDAAGGYFMFTTHTPDAPYPVTVDNPLVFRGGEAPGPPADSGSLFDSNRPLGRAERRRLVRLLRQWRDTSIPRETLRGFNRYAKLKEPAAIEKALQSMSEKDQELLSVWYVIRELEGRRR